MISVKRQKLLLGSNIGKNAQKALSPTGGVQLR